MTFAVKPRLEHFRGPFIGLVAVCAVSMALVAFRPASAGPALLVLQTVVLAAAWWGGMVTGLTATAASVLASSYLFMPPLYSLRVASGHDLLSLSLAASEGILISWLCAERGRLRSAHRTDQAEIDALRGQLDRSRRLLSELETDLGQLGAAVPGYIAPAVSMLREARNSLAGQRPPDAMAEAEQGIAAFGKALEDYCSSRGGTAPGHAPSGEAIEHVILDLGPALARAGARVVRPEQLPAVRVLRPHLQRVFTELLANAVQYRSSEAPVIEIACTRRESASAGTQWEFRVSDNGVGMVPFHRSRAFVFLGRTRCPDPAHPGAGLAVARRIVRSYGGEMWIESSCRRGTSVFFTVPA